MSLNVLFVSIAFPPKLDPECLQTAKYFKYLVRDKSLNIDVVTSPDKTLFMPVDENLQKYAKGYRQIIKVPFFENKYVNFLLRKIDSEILQYPDSKYRFAKKWASVLTQLDNIPDVIYSRSSPLSSTVMAYNIQQQLKIPWVLHLSDPWTIDPDHFYGKSRKWNEEMEQKCFEDASVLSFTSMKTIELYQEKYPALAHKMRFFPNVFDIDDSRNISYKLKSKIKVVFTGGLVGNRSPIAFFNAILFLYQKYPEIVSDYEFIFAGALDRRNKAYFEQNIPSVKHIGQLNYSEALNLQAEADMLLLIDTPFENQDQALFFPSKLLDYMLMKKRIIALTDKNGTSWDFINGKIGECFVHNDTESIAEALKAAWYKWKVQDENYFIHENIDMNYSAEYNAKQLARLFHKLHKQDRQ